MSYYTYAAYEIDYQGDDEEHLRQFEFHSPYEAVRACLSTDRRLSYLIVERDDSRRSVGQISPHDAWGTWDEFASLVDVHIRSTKIQLGEDETLDEAAESLIIGYLERKQR
jgi:hypothetical protein